MLKAMHDFTTFDLCLGGGVVVLVIVALGAIANMVLKDNGFGTPLNGLLLTIGMLTGVFVRALTFGFQ